MSEFSDDQIRQHAHQLWEKHGKPEGKADEFWHQAKAELESDEPGNEPNPDNPKPMPE
jgi:hypothetical protein